MNVPRLISNRTRRWPDTPAEPLMAADAAAPAVGTMP